LNEETQNNTNLLKIIKILSISNNSRHIPVDLNFLMTSVPVIESEISKTIAELMYVGQITDVHKLSHYHKLSHNKQRKKGCHAESCK